MTDRQANRSQTTQTPSRRQRLQDTRDSAGARDTAETAATAVGGDSREEPQVAAAFEEADAALTAAAEAHDDYREAITDATVALNEVARFEGREVPDEPSGASEFAGIDTDELDTAALQMNPLWG